MELNLCFKQKGEGRDTMTDWKKLLDQGIEDITELAGVLGIDRKDLSELCRIQEMFPMYVNPYYLSLIDFEDSEDPIRKMCIPDKVELKNGGDFDTSGEHDNTVMNGMQHKYAPTVLILSTNKCAMYCRHCFRKRLVGLSEEEIAQHIDDMVRYVKEHTKISNVLISGGDAFLNSSETIQKYLEEFTAIPHIDLIRFGTRTPVVLPQRITTDPGLVAMLEEYGRKKQIYVVTQFNHPREITAEAAEAVRLLMRAGIVVRNQTVLLRGVNDTPEVLGALLRGLTSIGVIPYYIFQCRPVTGVHSQFQVPLHEAYRIVEGAKQLQSGQGKGLRYVLSHVTGKIEILGEMEGGQMLFKYHQAKDLKNAGRIFTQEVSPGQCWLDIEE
ncbi:MAG: KamA family radical SAM protein [Lachnospiraceae bacterium]|jgi:lysine 2,3-aminomutase|nr:KamA family radical SAM protein [Lachnospiraceae bacterium]